MKKSILPVTFLLATFLFSFQQPAVDCDQKTLKSKCKTLLGPFTYDSAKMTKLTPQKKAQTVEVEVPVFIGEKYRLIFNMAQAPGRVIVNVYNKSKDAKKRELLFSTKDSSATDKEFIYDTPRLMKLFVDYEVPADTSAARGCAVFMVGYK